MCVFVCITRIIKTDSTVKHDYYTYDQIPKSKRLNIYVFFILVNYINNIVRTRINRKCYNFS